MMKQMIKTIKVLIQWIEIMPDSNPIIQTRKYNNEDKADAFMATLPERGIKQCTKKKIETVFFEEN